MLWFRLTILDYITFPMQKKIAAAPAGTTAIAISLFFFFCEHYFLRTVINSVLRHDDVIKADAAGVQRMTPFMIMTMPPAKSGDRNPAVDKQRIQKQVQPGFKRSTDLPQHGNRENILTHAYQRPNLQGNYHIEDVGVKGNVVINIATDNEECGNHQKVRR